MQRDLYPTTMTLLPCGCVVVLADIRAIPYIVVQKQRIIGRVAVGAAALSKQAPMKRMPKPGIRWGTAPSRR